MGGFSLFGRSGDNQSTQNTTNVTNDTTVTTTDSNNVSSVLNAALTKNESYIRNESTVMNTALQLTDSFNRFTTNNLANVGNTTIASPGQPSAMDYASFFGSAPQPKVTQTDLSQLRPLLDFNYLGDQNVRQLAGLSTLNASVQDGFAKNVAATGNSANLLSGGGASNTILYIILALSALVAVWIVSRRK